MIRQVCDGATVKSLSSSTPSVQVSSAANKFHILAKYCTNDIDIQVCDMGKLKIKNLKQVGKGAPQIGGGWYLV